MRYISFGHRYLKILNKLNRSGCRYDGLSISNPLHHRNIVLKLYRKIRSRPEKINSAGQTFLTVSTQVIFGYKSDRPTLGHNVHTTFYVFTPVFVRAYVRFLPQKNRYGLEKRSHSVFKPQTGKNGSGRGGGGGRGRKGTRGPQTKIKTDYQQSLFPQE